MPGHETNRAAVILAAGRGRRFRSATPKVVHDILGRPLVGWVVAACREAGIDDIVVVVSPAIRDHVADVLPDIRIVVQEQPLGTADAVAAALPVLPEQGQVVVVSGDTPCLRADTIARTLDAAARSPLALLTCRVPDPHGYGRVVRAADGSVERIVEHADADDATRRLNEINAGLYAFDIASLRRWLPQIGTDNAQQELYLVDTVAICRAEGKQPVAVLLDDPDEIQGINDRVQLAAASDVLRRRIIDEWRRRGVTVRGDDVVIEPDVELAPDVEVAAGVELRGRTRIAGNARIDRGCVLDSVRIAEDAHLLPYVVAEACEIGPAARIGPFAHLRPGTRLGRDVRVGNFVETKNIVMGEGSKASHLTYLGDAEIGSGVNIGAGTITCNYDGANKHRTIIEDDVFVGSDTQFVAPVRIGRGATIGAGTTVTRDVSPGALAVRRAPQKEYPDYPRKKKRTDP